MNSWRPYPLLRLVFPFLAGIIAEISCGLVWFHGAAPVATMFFLILATQLFVKVAGKYRFRWITGIMSIFFSCWPVISCRDITGKPTIRNTSGMQGQRTFLACIAEPPSAGEENRKSRAGFQVCLKSQPVGASTCGFALGYLEPGTSASLAIR